MIDSKIKNALAKANGLEFEGDYILGLVTNTTSIAGIVKMNSIDVDLSDGIFEVILVKNPKDLVQLNKILNGFVTCKFDDEMFDFVKTGYIQFTFDGDVSWSLDGEEKKVNRFVTIENLKERMMLIK
jgi:diacylglycerol kinase family enzyme